MHRLEADYYGKVNFVYLDVDDAANGEAKKQLGFRYQPQFHLLDGDGNVLQTWVGGFNEQEFVSVVEKYLE